ncbi:glycerate kinase [Angustibacter luteus]
MLVAPDSFKGTMSAQVVADALAAGLAGAGADAVTCPLADGGEGTTAVLHAAWGGELVRHTVSGPSGEPVVGELLLAGDGRAALDTASASGLHLVPAERRDPLRASTFGTGQLIAAAVAAGAREVLVGVGGSATTDGGAGALEALARAGGIGDAVLRVLCDVWTPFEQAAEVFGPQKGATADQVAALTARLHEVAGRLPRDPRGRPRTGAAGGLSGALWAVYGADLVSGADAVLDAVRFDELLARTDLVVTGEGCLDAQTGQGKLVAVVAARSARRRVPVVAVVGRRALDDAGVARLGLRAVIEAGDLGALESAGAALARDLAG